MKHPPLTFEYSRITPLINIGTNMCCQNDFAESLLRKGIRADVSLEAKKIDSPFGVDYYLWLPTKDHHAPTLQQLEIGVRFLQQLARHKIKCYVHCERGHGRAPTLVAAYLIAKGMSVEEAIKFIKKKRPAVHPNPKQRRQLRKWARYAKRVTSIPLFRPMNKRMQRFHQRLPFFS